MEIDLLSWSPLPRCKAQLDNGLSLELIVPSGATGYVVLFAVAGPRRVISGKTTKANEPELL